MRICYVCSFKEDSGGGVSQVVTTLSNYFSKDHDVLVVTPGEKTRMFYDDDRKINFIEVGAVGEGLLYIPKLNIMNIRKIFGFMKSFSPDIIHLHDEGPIPLLFLSFAKILSKHTVLTLHMDPLKVSPVINDIFPRFGCVFNDKNSTTLSKIFTSLTDHVITLNFSSQKKISKLAKNTEISLICNAICFSSYEDCRYDDRFLLFVGHIVPDKGIDFLIEVMRWLPRQYSLNLVGETPNPRYLEELKKKIEKYHLENIIFTGRVPHSEIPELLSKAQLFVSGSLLEVQSLSILEALASGTPVVSLSNQTTDEFIDDTVGKNLPAGTAPQVFAERVREICEGEKSLYDEKSKNARDKIKGLNIDIIGSQTMRLYTSLCERSPDINIMKGIFFVFLSSIFAKSVRILYFLNSLLEKYEQKCVKKS